MLKDIPKLVVEDIAIAIVPKENEIEVEGEESLWEVYIINLREEVITNVITSSKGYGSLNGETVKTSVLRHFLGTIQPLDLMLVEPITEKVFGLNNEYWVSFYVKDQIFDKKFIFLPETINTSNFTRIPFMDKKGVMIR